MSAALQSVRSTPIPWHCQMAADRLIAEILRGDLQAKDVASTLMRQVRDRMERKRGRHSPARPSQLIDLEREWRLQMPAESRLGYTADWVKSRRNEPKGVVIHDYRASAFGVKNTRWGPDHSELAFSLLLVEARILPDDVKLSIEQMGFVLRHALGRRFERGHPATNAAVVEDLRILAHARLVDPDA